MYVVTIDVGTGGFHVAIYAESGGLLAADYKAIGYESEELTESLSFDPERLFAVGMKLMSATIARAGLDSRRAVTIALTGQRHGCVFHDAQMRPVLAVANLDGRVDRETLDRYAPHRSEIYRISGRVPSEIFPALRLAWMRDHDPHRLKRISGFLMINEWFAYRLSGVARSEITSITESLLFDVAGAERSARLDELFGQEGITTWPVVAPGTVVGTVRDDVSRTYELPAKANVSLGAGDTQCAAIGSGAFTPGDVVAVNGSTTPV
ncbi:MAG: FGGY family carbohydrate kinase, partial [Spirochaeta sp.]|nr:FGGY family carbohydrate kinase [Spirochaeta sp.]